MKMRSSLLVAGSAMMLFIASCQKEDSTSSDIPANVAEATANEIEFTETFEDLLDNTAGIDGTSAGEDLGMYGANGFGLFPSEPNNATTSRCFTVTVTPRERGVFPKTVVLDFGDGCQMNGKLRKGKIITVYSGPLHKPGNRAVTEFDGYQVNNLKITGRHVIENTTLPGSNQRQFTRTYQTKVLNTETQVWRQWAGTTTMTQVEGNGTPFWPGDDIFQFTGSRRGENSLGRSWTAEVTIPLVKSFTCRWISKGVIKISVNDKTGTLDYGNGACDNEAVITVNGVSRTIKLR